MINSTLKSVILSSILGYIMLVSQGCATIVGGAQYRAYIEVAGHPTAQISRDGLTMGNGSANFKVKRRDANKLSITVQEDGCAEQTFLYDGHKFRGGTLFFTIILWTGTPPIIIPYGVILDAATGAWWKPDHAHPDITKIDYDNFHYKIKYTGCGEDYQKERQHAEDDYY